MRIIIGRKTPSSMTPQHPNADDLNNIRLACIDDVPGIVDIQMRSFPEVYDDSDVLIHRLVHDLQDNRDFCQVLVTNGAGERGPDDTVHGVVMLESYLHATRQYRNSSAPDETILLSVNRPWERNPADHLLMAATRADPALLKDEFLFVPELCVHPRMRGNGYGTGLMRYAMGLADSLDLKIVVIAEGSVHEAAQKWAEDESEEVDRDDLDALLREQDWPATASFYEQRLGFQTRSYFFWGRQDSAIPRIFHVLQHQSCICRHPPFTSSL